MNTRTIQIAVLCLVMLVSTAFAGNYQSVAVYAKQSKDFSEYEIAAATIASLMGRKANIMKVKSDDGDIFYVKYKRSDNTYWANKCKFDGSRVIWGSREGRWRTHPADDRITYKVSGNKLTISTNTGIEMTFTKSDFK
jgi:hypothetical protein